MENHLTDNYDDRIVIDSPVSFQLFSSVSGDEALIIVIITTADQNLSGNLKLRVGLLTEEVNGFYTGSNGQSEFDYDLVQYLPNAAGTAFQQNANTTATYTFTTAWPITLTHPTSGSHLELTSDNLVAVAFIQNDANEEVLNAEWAPFGNGTYLVSCDQPAHLAHKGESTETQFNVWNFLPEANPVNVEVTSSLPNGWSYSYTTPDGNATGSGTYNLTGSENFASTLTITTTENMDDADGTITFTFSSASMPGFSNELVFYTAMCEDILFINGVPDGHFSEFYTQSLAGIPELDTVNYTVWDNSAFSLDVSDFTDAMPRAAVWFTGGDGVIVQEDATALVDYLEAGGRLWMTGSNAPANLANSALIDMMHASYQGEYANGTQADGQAGDPIGNELAFGIGGGDGADNRGTPTSLTNNGGTACLWYSVVRRAGIWYANETYKTFLMGFPFEAIADSESRKQLMKNWLLVALEGSSGSEEIMEVSPATFALHQNYPNPFNPSTEISFTLPRQSEVTITVFDVTGRETAQLVSGLQQAGEHSVLWNAKGFASGVYFCRMIVNSKKEGFVGVRRMLLLN